MIAEWLESAPCNTKVPSSNTTQAALQMSNMFEITLVAEDHEPSKGKVCEPLIGDPVEEDCYLAFDKTLV